MFSTLLKQTFLFCTGFILLFSCTQNKPEENKTADKTYSDVKAHVNKEDYLIAVSEDSVFERGHTHAFINLKGDTIIPFGRYSHCLTDTLKTYAIVYDSANTNGVTVAIDRNEHILFDVVFFDNWQDELHDGLFRVRRNGKIGYANISGEIIIPCQFACAFWFENGRAKVTYNCTENTDDCGHTLPESDEWFYIDTKGKRIQ